MIYRIYVEKKPAYATEAAAYLKELRHLLGIRSLSGLRLFNRYDVENISEELFCACRDTVFSEPPLDLTYRELPPLEATLFASEYLPGQFDQRADSCAQCIQLISQGERPLVQCARVFALEGDLSAEEIARIKKHLINPVESREASLDLPATLAVAYPPPAAVPQLCGFAHWGEQELQQAVTQYNLAMNLDDIRMVRDYFASEQRDPTLAELRLLDTYWSDHCRHTTFHTRLTTLSTQEAPAAQAAYQRYLALRQELGVRKPVSLMDMATLGAKALKAQGRLLGLDESEEVNACTVKIKAEVEGQEEDWRLLFKNETHNHPTEIEPFGGAATCIGGAIRDPLSGRAHCRPWKTLCPASCRNVPS